MWENGGGTILEKTMARWMIVCAGLVMLGLLAQAQDKPQSKPVTFVLHFEDAELAQVMARVSEHAGYKVLWGRNVDSSTGVTIDAGAVTIDLACMFLADYTDLNIIVNHKRKLIEVDEAGSRSLLTEVVYIDTRRHHDAFVAGEKAIGRQYRGVNDELRDANTHDATNALDDVLLTAIRFETSYEYVSLGQEGFTARLDATELENVEEVFRLLMAENGGRSRWLEAQSSAWEKIRSGALTIKAEGTPLADVLADVAKKLGVHWLADRDVQHVIEQETVTFEFDRMPALDVLDLLLGRADLKMVLLGSVIYVLQEDAETLSIIPTGYAVYELGALIGERAAASEGKSDTPTLDAFEGILDGLEVAIDALEFDLATFGTRLVIRGDSRRQQAATDYLTALGWKGK
jgi:hypothetical protein